MAFDPLTAGLDLGGRILEVVGRFIPDPAEQAKLTARLIELTSSERIAQLDVNAVEAASPSVYVAGWRPAVGWCCVGALAIDYIVAPLLGWACLVFGVVLPPLPQFDSIMSQLLFGVLGLTIGARTVEKVQGVAAINLAARPDARGAGT